MRETQPFVLVIYFLIEILECFHVLTLRILEISVHQERFQMYWGIIKLTELRQTSPCVVVQAFAQHRTIGPSISKQSFNLPRCVPCICVGVRIAFLPLVVSQLNHFAYRLIREKNPQ